MGRPEVYQDGARIKSLAAELASLNAERADCEAAWESASPELEALDAEMA